MTVCLVDVTQFCNCLTTERVFKYIGYKDRKRLSRVNVKFSSHIQFFFIYNILGNVPPLTVSLEWVDFDEVDSVLVAVVMTFRGSLWVGARLLEQKRCGHKYQDINY